jgi:hypothetical protein
MCGRSLRHRRRRPRKPHFVRPLLIAASAAVVAAGGVYEAGQMGSAPPAIASVHPYRWPHGVPRGVVLSGLQSYVMSAGLIHRMERQIYAVKHYWYGNMVGLQVMQDRLVGVNGDVFRYDFHHAGAPWGWDAPVNQSTWDAAFGYLAARGIPVMDGEFANYVGSHYWGGPGITDQVARPPYWGALTPRTSEYRSRHGHLGAAGPASADYQRTWMEERCQGTSGGHLRVVRPSQARP